MAALRSAAGRLAGQRLPAIFRPAVAVEQPRLLPALARTGSPAYSRRFFSSEPDSYSRRFDFETPACAELPPWVNEKNKRLFNQLYQIEEKKKELFYLLADLENRSQEFPLHAKLRLKFFLKEPETTACFSAVFSEKSTKILVTRSGAGTGHEEWSLTP